MAKLSAAAVLLLVVVPLCMYTCALLVGVQIGRVLERRPDSVVVTIGIGDEALGYVVAEEVWDSDVSGSGRDEGASRHPYTWWPPLRLESSANLKAQGMQQKPHFVSAGAGEQDCCAGAAAADNEAAAAAATQVRAAAGGASGMQHKSHFVSAGAGGADEQDGCAGAAAAHSDTGAAAADAIQVSTTAADACAAANKST